MIRDGRALVGELGERERVAARGVEGEALDVERAVNVVAHARGRHPGVALCLLAPFDAGLGFETRDEGPGDPGEHDPQDRHCHQQLDERQSVLSPDRGSTTPEKAGYNRVIGTTAHSAQPVVGAVPASEKYELSVASAMLGAQLWATVTVI